MEWPIGSGGLAVAILDIGSAIDYTAKLRPVHGPAAHEAGLDRDVERSLWQVFAAHIIERGGKGQHLGMGGTVIKPLNLVVAARYDLTIAHHYSTYRDFLRIKRHLRLPQGLTHKILIIEHMKKRGP